MLAVTLAVTTLMLLLLVPLVGSVRDFLQELPATVEQLRASDELSWLGDSGAAGNVQDGAQQVSVSVPDAISGVLGIAGSFFGLFLAAFTIIFICLFLLSDIVNLKRALASVLDARRGGTLARRLGEGHDLDLALGDRGGHHLGHRRGDAGNRRRGCSGRATPSLWA